MKLRTILQVSTLVVAIVALLAGCTGIQPLPMDAPVAEMDAPATDEPMAGPVHAEGLVVSHPSTGAMEPIDGTAHIVRSDEGVLVQMHAMGLEPGYVYTGWWVLANHPDVCEEDPCSGGDFIGKAAEAETVVSYADGVIVDASGAAHFASFLPVGEVEDDPWFPENAFTNPMGAEIHLVLNSHGPLIPEMAEAMVNSYRAGCTDDSLPPPFPDTAKADGEPGPNTCALVQAAIFQPDDESGTVSVEQAEGLVVSHPSTGAMEPIDGTAHIVRSDEGVLVQMHAMGLEPGNVYTGWWVLANHPDVCEEDPCSGGDFIGKAAEAETVVSYADGVIVDESGAAHFASFLPVGEVEDDPWFPENAFTNPMGAEIHLVLNSHGPLIPEMAEAMVNSYRAGCTDDSLPPPFPDTAKADGEPGPNACALVQAAIFQAQ